MKVLFLSVLQKMVDSSNLAVSNVLYSEPGPGAKTSTSMEQRCQCAHFSHDI